MCRFEKHLILAGVTLLTLLPLGLLGVMSPFVLWPLFGAHLLFLIRANSDGLRLALETLAPRNRVALLVGVALFVTAALAMCLVPVTARDALIHHLAVPKWWLESGQISTFAWHDVSYYPMLIQLAFAPLLQAFAPQATAIYHCLYLIPFAASALRLTRVLVEADNEVNAAPLYGFIIALTLPIALRLASEPLVDLALGAYCGVAITLLLQRKLSSGLALGLALSVKYNALPYAAFLLLAAPIARVPIRFLARVLLLAVLIVSPWLVRNALETGNPLYPLGAGTASLSSIESRTLLYGESPFELLLTPVMMAVRGADEDPRRFDGVLSPLLLLSTFAVWRFRRNRLVATVTLTIVAYFILAQLSSGARVRYLLPILPAVCALTALALASLRVRLVFGLLCAHLLYSGAYLTMRIERIKLIPFLSAAVTSDAYLSSVLPEYRFTQSLAAEVGPDEQVYTVLTGNRFFYLPFKAQSGGYLSGPELVEWVHAARVAKELQARGCALLLVNVRLFERLNTRNDVISLTSALDAQLTRIKQEGDFVLFRSS